jgi:signal transduction histidine kinase
VALVDVLRAATSEIEQYERVTLNVQPGVSVRMEAVSDVVHLTAELVENATSFSAADTPVTIAAHMQNSGWALIEIGDQGVGLSAEEIAQVNWRLDRPPVVDVAVSRRMGLFVVARLAARHGIRVRLCPVPSGGLIAQIWLPDETITRETGAPAPPRSVPVVSGNRTATAATVSGDRPGRYRAGTQARATA